MKSIKLLFTGVVVSLLHICTIAQNSNVTFRSQLQYPNQSCANICGYVDGAGNEYALVGAQLGMSIVDVTDPANPVEVMQVPGANNHWREIKVSGDYAYVTTEGGGGLQIVNLSSLPNVAGVTYHDWTGDGVIAGQLSTIHALHIDGHYVYLYGSNLFDGGALVADITDPWNPTYAGHYSVGTGSQPYVHDGYVRNDTLYASHIYAGYFSVVDFTNKANPVELANQVTPTNFTHNTWLSQNGNVLFTTDETDDSYLTSYDISNLTNITELDRLQSNPGSGSGVHNTHIINVAGNDYAVTSWYRDGFTIADVGRPQNMVQVGNYDTYSGTGPGFDGAWGVYPYLPSGTIVVSNIDEGLFVFTPTYTRACYLEGHITNACGGQLSNVQVTATAAGISETSDISGEYKTGTPTAGTYTITFSKSGYVTQSITGVVLSSGNVTTLDVQLAPTNGALTINGLTTDAATTTPLAGVNVSISDNSNAFNFTSDANGAFTSCNVLSDTDYNVIAGKWGYITHCASNQVIDSANSNLSYALNKGYYDDFTFDFGWTVNSTASTGIWQRGVPLGTDFNNGEPANPGVDVANDCGNRAYVTGNTGLDAASDDVDNGATTLTSPVFDLNLYTEPYLCYSRWFYNSGGTGNPNDSLCIYLNNGSQTVRVEYVLATTPGNSSWVDKSFRIADYITPTATMKVIVKTADVNPGHILEAGFDKFFINEGPVGIEEQHATNNNVFKAYPNPFNDEITLSYQLTQQPVLGATVVISDIAGRRINEVPVSKQTGTIQLAISVNAGVYFAHIVNGTEITKPLKIVKVK